MAECVDCRCIVWRSSVRCRSCENKARVKQGRITHLRGEQHQGWKGDGASAEVKRKRARRLFTLGTCDRCGAVATDRHHVDTDPGNNDPANIAGLCRRCHMIVDGRLERWCARVRPVQPSRPCVRCSIPSKPLRKGRCQACAEYLRRTDCERPEHLYSRPCILVRVR